MKLITFDAETFWGDGFSLSDKSMTTEKYIRDPRFKLHGAGIKVNNGPSRWVKPQHIPQVLEKLDVRNCALIGHNLQFDGSILGWKYGIYPKLYIDTMGLSRALIGPHAARHGLKYAAEKLCGMTKMDELIKTYNLRELPPHIEACLADYTVGLPRWNEAKQLWEAGDVELTYAIFTKMMPHFPTSELEALDWTIRAFTDPKLYLDQQLLGNYIQEVKEQKQVALEDVYWGEYKPGFRYYVDHTTRHVYRAVEQLGMDEVSRNDYITFRVEGGYTADKITAAQHEELRSMLASADKYAAALSNIGVTPPTKISAKTGKVSYAFAKTDEEHKALLEHDSPAVQALVAARLEVKSTIEETRAILYHDAAGRGAWPVAYNYAGAQVTQRYSGNKGGGGNPQNMKRGGTLRRAIFAPEGFVIGVPDLSQIEARLTLWLGMQITGPDGEEAKALQVMAEGGDIYSYFGTKFYGYIISKKETPFERQVSKSGVLGLGFGMGPPRFIAYCKQNDVQGIDERFAEDMVKFYRGTYVGVRKFWAQCQKAVNTMLDGQYGYSLPFDGLGLVTTCMDPLFNEPAIRLPNGLCIKYPGLHKNAEGEITYLDGGKKVKLFGGKICENIVQAIAAWIMRMQKVKLNKQYRVVMSSHDELPTLVPEGEEAAFEKICTEIMTAPIKELPGLPLAIEVGCAIRYGDAKS